MVSSKAGSLLATEETIVSQISADCCYFLSILLAQEYVSGQ